MENIRDDNVKILVGIEFNLKKIPYFISFYQQTNVTRKGILNFEHSNERTYDDNLKVLLTELKRKIVNEISNIEQINESKIIWIFCVDSDWNEEKKNKLKSTSVDARLINSSEDKRIIILEKGMALTTYFEKEKHIEIELDKPYIIIIANEEVNDSLECLEKNRNENKIITARKSFFKLNEDSLSCCLCRINFEHRREFKIFYSGTDRYYNWIKSDLEEGLSEKLNCKFKIFNAESQFGVSKGAIDYYSLKINDSNTNINFPYICYENVLINNNVISGRFFDKKKNKQNEENENYNPKVIACIDFGTSGTDYCFAFNQPGRFDPIHCGLPGTEGKSSKSPSEIIIDQEYKTIKFGVGCKEYISSSQLKNTEYYFSNIKMHLYQNLREIQPQNSESNFPIGIIISKILTEVKEEAIHKIQNYDSVIQNKDIKWVVTIPAIWSDVSKQIMIEASLNAGLIHRDSDRSLFLCYEPEAAAYYCQYEGTPIPENKPYIVCDLGGGTADIVCHMKYKINNRIQIKQVHEPVGGPYGSNEINKEIYKKIIIPFFGEEVYNTTLQNSKEGEEYMDLYKLESNIQYFKESLSSKFKGIFQRKNIEDSKINEFAESEEFTLENFIQELKIQCENEDNFKLDCTLFKYSTDLSLEEFTKRFNEENNNLKLTSEVIRNRRGEKWYLNIPYEIILDITIDFINKISQKIEEILENPRDMDINSIHSIIYVGGYFSSKVVFWLLKKKLTEKFKNKGLNTIKHILLKEPNLAVVKGGTLFGLNPDLISSRKSEITLGIKCIKDGKFFFDRFLNVGDDIYPEKVVKHSFKMHGNQIAVFELIKCNIMNPSPYDENLFTHHCTLTPLDIGRGHREGERIELHMKIGTFINCFGYYENEEKINVNVDFISNVSPHNEINDFDILYMIDGTGSMGKYIEAAKRKCIEISEELDKTYIRKLNFKYGVIFYRDPIDEKNDKHENFPLDNIINVKNQIESVRAYGGGDEPEDWVGAFKIALDTNIMRWRKGTKLIIHIADAPAHGDEFAGKKNYTDEGPKLVEQIKNCVEQKIKIFGLFIGKSAEKSFLKFKEYYDDYDRENKGLYKVVNFDEGEGRDIAEKFKSLVLQAVHTIEPLDN